jgi:hypothetical protein
MAPAAAQSATYVDKATIGYKSEPDIQLCSTCLHWNNSACRVVHDANNPGGRCQAYTTA